MQTPSPDSPEPESSGAGAAGDAGAGAAGFWDRYSGREREATADETGEAGRAAEGAGDQGHLHGATDQGAGGHHGAGGHQCLDWCPICRGADVLRAAVPPELQAQFQLVQRDALLMAQALIEAQLERMRERQYQGGAAAGPSAAAGSSAAGGQPPDADDGVATIPLD